MQFLQVNQPSQCQLSHDIKEAGFMAKFYGARPFQWSSRRNSAVLYQDYLLSKEALGLSSFNILNKQYIVVLDR